MAKAVDKIILDVARENYRHAIGADMHDDDRDENGFIVLRPTQEHVENRQKSLTTDIDQLQARLKTYMSEKKHFDDIAASDDFKNKSKKSKKKKKKAKASLLASIFNNADNLNSDTDENSEEDDDGYEDIKGEKKPKAKSTKPKDTLDSTYGMRFAPVVSYLKDAIDDFDAIADEIQEELETKGTSRGVYRSSQMANLISAKNSKLSAVKELAAVARVVSDLEYKKAKDKSANDENKDAVIARFGSRYLSGGFDDLDITISASGGKKKGKVKDKKKKHDFSSMTDDEREEYDEEDYGGTVEKGSSKKGTIPEQKELAKRFAEKILQKKDKLSFTPNEKYIEMEGKYEVVVVVEDPINPSSDWKFTALDKKGREIEGFRKDYKELLPNKKASRMVFDMVKLQATNKATGLKYRILVKD